MEDSRGKSPAFEVVRNIALGIQLCNGDAYKLFSLVVFNPRYDNGCFKFILKIFFFFTGFSHMVGNCPWVGPGKPHLPLGLRGKDGGCARVTAWEYQTT